jgi:energy-coupling factor transporter ATP-binding protein EcfA2
MNNADNKLHKSSAMGKLFSRTADNCEVEIPQWNDIITDVINLTQSANVIISISADEGAGKTTFLKLLKHFATHQMDVILVAPTCAINHSGWLIEAITPWLTGGTEKYKSLQKSLTDLAETARPITICIDSNDLIETQTLANDVSALINLADTGNLRLSIVICGSHDFIQALNADKRAVNRIIFSKELPSLSEAQAKSFIVTKLQILNNNSESTIAMEPNDIDNIIKSSDQTPLGLIKAMANTLGLDIGPSKQAKSADKKPSKIQTKDKTTKESKASPIDDLLSPRKI